MESEIIVALHLAYSIGLLAINGPILRIHAGLISRSRISDAIDELFHRLDVSILYINMHTRTFPHCMV